MSDDGFTLSWSDVLRVAPEYVRPLLKDPRTYIWTLIIGGVLSMWSQVLGYVSSVWATIAEIPGTAIRDPLLAAGTAFRVVPDTYQSVGESITSMAVNAGLFAPIALALGWVIPTILLVALLYGILQLVDTYLPFSALPVVGRWFR